MTTNLGERLLPCPFCGKQPEIDDVDDARDGGYVPDDCLPIKAIIISCSKCGIEQHGNNEAAAFTSWNTRSESSLLKQMATALSAFSEAWHSSDGAASGIESLMAACELTDKALSTYHQAMGKGE